MSKMPRIWLYAFDLSDYKGDLLGCVKIIRRSIFSIAATQHDKLWEHYSKWALRMFNLEIGRVVYKWYSQYEPFRIKVYAEKLVEYGYIGQGVKIMMEILNNEEYMSIVDWSEYELDEKITTLMSQNGLLVEVEGVD